jgi:hypothetical protein
MNQNLINTGEGSFPVGFPLKSQRQKQLARVKALKEVIKAREIQQEKDREMEKENQKKVNKPL